MKELTIKIDEASAKIVKDLIKYYNLPKLRYAQEKDEFLDNNYLINACEKVVTTIETTIETAIEEK